MKNAHEPFGRLVYRRHTEKTATNLRVFLDAFVGEERGKAHLVSVVGGRRDRRPGCRILQRRLLEHRWVPNSGWITFQIRGEVDFKHALWLMRWSHLRYTLKTAKDPLRYLDDQSEELHLAPQLKSLFEALVPRSTVA